MSERLETLKKARARMVEDRDAFAKTLAAPFDRDKAERARLKFIETQVLIDAIDRAIHGEQAGRHPTRSHCYFVRRVLSAPAGISFVLERLLVLERLFVLERSRIARGRIAGPPYPALETMADHDQRAFRTG